MNANRFSFVLCVFAAIERGYFDDGQQDREDGAAVPKRASAMPATRWVIFASATRQLNVQRGLSPANVTRCITRRKP
jgi:hypothetical protein